MIIHIVWMNTHIDLDDYSYTHHIKKINNLNLIFFIYELKLINFFKS